MEDDWQHRPLTGAETAQLIHSVLENKVKPAIQHACGHLDNRVTQAEMDLHSLKLREAWVEKDMLQQQIQVAKRTAIFRGFPDTFTAEDRQLTVHKALKEAGIKHYTAEVFTGKYEQVKDKIELSNNTILNLQMFTDRQLLLQTFKGRDGTPASCTGWYWKELVQEDGTKKWDRNGDHSQDQDFPWHHTD